MKNKNITDNHGTNQSDVDGAQKATKDELGVPVINGNAHKEEDNHPKATDDAEAKKDGDADDEDADAESWEGFSSNSENGLSTAGTTGT